MAKTKLDPEEQELLEAYESGEFESDLDTDRREYLAGVAKETFKKDKRINIRISSRDLDALQPRALEEGFRISHWCLAQICLRAVSRTSLLMSLLFQTSCRRPYWRRANQTNLTSLIVSPRFPVAAICAGEQPELKKQSAGLPLRLKVRDSRLLTLEPA